MARYDRIAALDLPDRERAFGGWSIFRDLDGRDRDTDLGRRARLRFLALRPVRRLAEWGIDTVPADSFEQQLAGVQAELDQLPARDPERIRLDQFVERIRERTPLAVTTAVLELGELIESARHYHAAGEFYRSALDLADAYRLTPEQVITLRLLGRVYGKIGEWSEAERSYTRAAGISLHLDDHRQWSRSIDGIGKLFRRQQKLGAAAGLYRDVLARGQELGDDRITAIGLTGLCQIELDAGNLDQALEHGWAAVGLARDGEDRDPALVALGEAFARLGLYPAAERCLTTAATRSRRPQIRAQARLHLAAAAAGSGRIDTARDHLRESIRIAQELDLPEIMTRAEGLLGTLERAAGGEALPRPTTVPGEVARRIAAEIEALGEPLVPASG